MRDFNACGLSPTWVPHFPPAPDVPPVGAYDVKWCDTTHGPTSFDKTTRFKHGETEGAESDHTQIKTNSQGLVDSVA